MRASEKEEYLEKGKDWVGKVIEKNPTLVSRFVSKTYKHGQKLKFYDRDYTISITPVQSRVIHIDPGKGVIQIPANEEGLQEASGEMVAKTLQKLIARVYRPIVTIKGIQLAAKHKLPRDFDLTLRYMSSKWGSCSKIKGNMSINTRLMLAPEKILDSVLLHEICHLVHANHSHDFWSLVQKVDPDYKLHIKWLKTNGPLLKL